MPIGRGVGVGTGVGVIETYGVGEAVGEGIGVSVGVGVAWAVPAVPASKRLATKNATTARDGRMITRAPWLVRVRLITVVNLRV
jgi:hypothetical protein